MRRRGVPCGCTDNGGCCGLKEKLAILWDRTIGSILKINDQTPDGDGKFRILDGSNIEITDVSNGIRIGVDPTQDLALQADLTVDGDIVANGDIIQNGSAYETHAEKIYTNDDYIVMREGAVGPLGAGDFSGFQVTKYDGSNDGRLVMDRDGVARVGDVGDEQPLATRDESADLTDNHLLKWDATNQKLVDTGLDADALGGGLEFVGATTEFFLPTTPGVEEIKTITTGPFEAGYDYFLFFGVAGADNANIRARYFTQTVGTTNVDLKIQATNGVTFETRLYRCVATTPYIPNTAVRLNTANAVHTDVQERLISGTNIKTINNQSILGSGDITIGGLTWTERSNSNGNWSDMFQVVDNKMTALKHIVLEYQNYLTYIPKGYCPTSGTTLYFSIGIHAKIGTNNYAHSKRVDIESTRLSATYSDFNAINRGFTLTTDGSTVTIANYSTSSFMSKYSFRIFVAD